MLYTSEDLIKLSDTAVPRDKWGQDTTKILSLVQKIKNANCSSCAMRRYMRELKSLLNNHGDDIAYNPTGYSVQDNKGGRTPCLDCVAKHLLEAYILASEYHQGYSDYLPLVEAHLTQALEECPKDKPELVSLINKALRSTIIDRYPDVPEVYSYDITLTDIDNTTKDKIPDECPAMEYDLLESSLDSMPTEIKIRYRPISIRMGALLSRNNPNIREICGCLAIISDFTAKYSPFAASVLRRLRLYSQTLEGSQDTGDLITIYRHVWTILDKTLSVGKNTQK